MKLHELKKGTKVEGELVGFYGDKYQFYFLGMDGMFGKWLGENGRTIIYGTGNHTLEDLELTVID